MMRWLGSVLCLVAAARGDVRTMTLKEALETALKQSPDLALARLDELKAALEIDVARDPFVPKVAVGSGLAYSSGFPMSIEGSAPSVLQARAVASIFNRSLKYQVAQARENARGAAIDSETRRDEVAWRTASYYFDARRAGQAGDAARKQIENLERIAGIVESRVAGGRELPIEAKRAALNLARARQRVQALSADQDNLEASLAVLLGYGPADRVRPAPEEPRTAAPADSEQAAIDAALAGSKQVRRLESAILAKGFEVSAHKATRLPQVDLVAQYALLARFNNYDEFFNKFQRHNGQFGVSFQVPVFAGSAARAQAAQAEGEVTRMRLEVQATRHRIAAETRRSFQEMKKAETGADVARLDLEVSRDQVSLLLAQLEAGRAGVDQLEQARYVENEKWIQFYEARAALDRARLDVLRHTGQLMAAVR